MNLEVGNRNKNSLTLPYAKPEINFGFWILLAKSHKPRHLVHSNDN